GLVVALHALLKAELVNAFSSSRILAREGCPAESAWPGEVLRPACGWDRAPGGPLAALAPRRRRRRRPGAVRPAHASRTPPAGGHQGGRRGPPLPPKRDGPPRHDAGPPGPVLSGTGTVRSP